jgi:hypothetical protein
MSNLCGGNPTVFTVEVKVGSCDSFKTAINIIGRGGGVRWGEVLYFA